MRTKELISPASGKILRFDADRQMLTIFMHLHNVHLTVAPLDGVVTRITPEQGAFKPAFIRSADFNTRNTIELSTAFGNICVVHIAGFLTRKILCDVQVGQQVQQGERLGKICFGSRVDISVPDGFALLVTEGARVRCGKTPLARKAK
ncbi:MAG TPA: phosphatidylserine decarboxylase family protein [Methanomicrobia archaeon]|mgnify:CR=1 FL=1|nr:phosphatidylserine decarboxylase family protein [Methanomicrobia archaeon]